MTTLRIDGKPGAAASAALEPFVARLYARPGMRLVGIVELAHVERTQPAPDSDRTASVKVKITHLEIPTEAQEGAVREAQRALYLQRTAAGTLSEDDGQVELAEETLRLTGGLLHAVEAARLKAALAHWAAYARRVVHTPELAISEIRHELQAVADGLAAALDGAVHKTDDG
ncbi:hypothetical protein AABB02_33695 [Streptomyces rimosus]|uniref:hypothetical protein n=1 Tax=Streptomyces rimosus TaxID=1927 RepID=UPI0031D78534